jgi:hypothetical protein
VLKIALTPTPFDFAYFLFALNFAHLAFWAAAILRRAAGESVRFPPAPFTFAHRLLCESAMRLRAAADMVLRPERLPRAELPVLGLVRTEIA